jgi:hypothetical protein
MCNAHIQHKTYSEYHSQNLKVTDFVYSRFAGKINYKISKLKTWNVKWKQEEASRSALGEMSVKFWF